MASQYKHSKSKINFKCPFSSYLLIEYKATGLAFCTQFIIAALAFWHASLARKLDNVPPYGKLAITQWVSCHHK